MSFAVLTQVLIGSITFLILLFAGRKKIFACSGYLVIFFLFYFIDNLAITLTNHFPGLQIVPNHTWEGFLLWGWSGKCYSIFIVLLLVYNIRSYLPLSEIGLTTRQHSGSLAPSLVVIFLIALGAFSLGVLAPRGKSDLGLLFYLAILPGLNEELVYRGVLPASLDRLFPKNWILASAKIGWGTLITTLLFGLLHGLWLDDHLDLHIEIVWIRNAFLSGLIFAWLKERTGSLLMPVIAHGAWDFFIFLPRMI
jgi:uncharacterized protein